MNDQLKHRIDNDFTYHAAEAKASDFKQLRDKAKELANLIADLVPQGREQALALTNLEQANFWANAGIARNQ